MSSLFIPWFQLGPWIVDVPFRDRDLVLHPFSVFVVTALVVGYTVALAFAKAHGRSVPHTMRLALYLVGFGFPISYLLNGLLYEPGRFFVALSSPAGLAAARLGWSMYGGILGALFGAWVWKWRTGGSILHVGEAFSFGGPFGWSVARAGCFVVHDHPGRATDFVLAVDGFRTGVPPYVPRHDLGFYDMLLLASIALVFAVLARAPRAPGFYVGLLPVIYAPCRFALDFLRAPTADGGDIRYGGLTPAQYGSLLLFAGGIAVLRHVRNRGS